jgi:alpha-tubulin suppressor-like RCC1 family protein
VAVEVQPPGAGSQLSFVSLSAGGDFTCGVTTSGAAYCWGTNDEGLGDGFNTNSATPVQVIGAASEVFEFVDVGFGHACALAKNQQVYCWGDNEFGQLGDGKMMTSSMEAVLVSGGLPFLALTVGDEHTCGIAEVPFELRFRSADPPEVEPSGGAMYCWGNNEFGQLGDGTNTPSSEPVRVAEPNPAGFF